MHQGFHRLMQEAARLVRAGDVRAATASIQAALQAEPPRDAAPVDMPRAPGIVIDVGVGEVGLPYSHRVELDRPGTAVPRAQGEGTFIPGRFADARTERDYKLYVPPQAGGRSLPLVVMLHGCTQDPDDFATGTRMNDLARAQGCFVLYPAQSPRANPQRCWNWFKHSHQQRGRGEPALLAAMTRHVMARHEVDSDRVYVAGLSAGGAMAAVLGDAYPDLYAAVGVHSGLACGAARDLPSALAVMRTGGAATGSRSGPPTIVFQGDADTTVHPSNGDHVIAACAGQPASAGEVERRSTSGGRSYTRRVHRSPEGRVRAELWILHGSGHAWSGGSRQGSFTDPGGPDATGEMFRFFLQHPRG
jgi:poly(hydroxyalkanoate) depolymerase family esterase